MNNTQEIYYRVEYKVGHSWQPIANKYKLFAEASKELESLLEAAKEDPNKISTEFRITEFVNRISMEVIKHVTV